MEIELLRKVARLLELRAKKHQLEDDLKQVNRELEQWQELFFLHMFASGMRGFRRKSDGTGVSMRFAVYGSVTDQHQFRAWADSDIVNIGGGKSCPRSQLIYSPPKVAPQTLGKLIREQAKEGKSVPFTKPVFKFRLSVREALQEE